MACSGYKDWERLFYIFVTPVIFYCSVYADSSFFPKIMEIIIVPLQPTDWTKDVAYYQNMIKRYFTFTNKIKISGIVYNSHELLSTLLLSWTHFRHILNTWTVSEKFIFPYVKRPTLCEWLRFLTIFDKKHQECIASHRLGGLKLATYLNPLKSKLI